MNYAMFLPVLLGFGVSNLYGASFECSNATEKVEKLICSDKELSLLDDELAAKYSQPTDQVKERKNAQRRWLREKRNRCSDIQCLKDAYETRIFELKWDADYADIAPKKPKVVELCQKLSSNSEKWKLMANYGGSEDINNDGQPEVGKKCDGGTARTPCIEYFDQAGTGIQIQQVGFEWKNYWTYGRQAFQHDGRTYILNSADDALREPSYLSYITPANKEYVLCEFANHVTAAVEYQADDSNGVCQAVLEKSALIKSVKLPEDVEIQPEFLDRVWTRATSIGLADVNNDGVQERVMGLDYESGAARGCDYNYFDLLADSEDGLMLGSTRSAFLMMQGGDDSGFSQIGCGNISNRLIRHKGKIFYEHNFADDRNSTHTISIQSGDDVRTVCEYKTEIKTDLKEVLAGEPRFGNYEGEPKLSKELEQELKYLKELQQQLKEQQLKRGVSQ